LLIDDDEEEEEVGKVQGGLIQGRIHARLQRS
jgi:hypothetical protein